MRDLGSNWRRLWAAGAISSLGDGAFVAAVPLLAVSITTNPRLVAGVATFGTLPWLLLSLHAGALADRFDRRRLMWLAQLVQAACVVLIAVVATFHIGHIWLLYAAAFGLGAGETVFGNAAQSMLPNVVAPAQLEATNGRQYATETVTEQFAGPPIGGLLFAAAAAVPFWLDAVSFVFSAVLIARIRLVAALPRTGPDTGATRRSMWRDIAEGLRWVARHRLIRTLALLLAATNLAGQLAWSTMVLFAVRELHVGPHGYGFLLAASAVGGVAGGLAGRRAVARLGTRGAIIAGSAIGASAMLTVGLFARNPYVMALCLTVIAFGATLWNVATVSLRQRIIPDRLRGRVNSAYRLAGWGAMPIGAAVGGLIAAAWGLPAPWLVAAVVRLGVLTTIVLALPAALFAVPAPEPVAVDGSGVPIATVSPPAGPCTGTR